MDSLIDCWCDYTWDNNWVNNGVVDIVSDIGLIIFLTFLFMSAESQELQEILSEINVSDIASVEFVPADGESFRLDTDNIKKLTRYITTKLEKEYFQPHELDKTYGYVIDNLYTDLPKEEYAAIRKQMKIFIEQ